jgi:hypothetical protein
VLENIQHATSSALSQAFITTNNQGYFPTSMGSATEATFDTRNHTHDDDFGLDDLSGEELAFTGFPGQQWSLNTASGAGSDAGVGMGSDFDDSGRSVLDSSSLPKASESWDDPPDRRSAFRSHGRVHGRNAAVNPKVSAGGESKQPIATNGFAPPPVWATSPMQTENNQWQQQQYSSAAGSPQNRSVSTIPTTSGSQKRFSSEQMDTRGVDTHNCSDCVQKRPREYRNGKSSMATPASTTTDISGSNVLREHGIDLAQVLSQATTARIKPPSLSTPRRISVSSPRNRTSDRHIPDVGPSCHCPHHRQHHGQPETPEMEQDEYEEVYSDASNPRVTKVVVVFMEGDRGGA